MALRFAATISGLFALMAAAAFAFFMVFYRNRMELCETRECINAAARILNAMDKTADPCNNFYQYACGGWFEDNPNTPEKNQITQFKLANDKTQSLLKDLLGSDHTHDRDAIKKLKKYYKACVDEDTLDRKDALPAFDLIEEYGGLPLFGGGIEEKDFNLEKYLANTKSIVADNLLKLSSPLINVYVEVDFRNSSTYIVFLDQPILGLTSHVLYLSSGYSYVQKAYRLFLHGFLRLLWEAYDKEKGLSTFNEKVLNGTVHEIYQMEAELAAFLDSEHKRLDILGIYNKMTIKEMTTEVSPDFNWLAYVNEAMPEVDPSTDVLVIGRRYLSGMMSVLKKYNSSAIQNYVIIYDLAKSLDLFPRKYRDTDAVLRKILYATDKREPRWKTCVTKATSILPRLVGAVYVQSEFSVESKDVVLEMIGNVVKSFTSELDKSEWMDNETKTTAKVKANAVAEFIGYRDYIVNASDPRLDVEMEEVEISEKKLFEAEFNVRRDQVRNNKMKQIEPVDRDEWRISPALMNAFYFPPGNSIIFPAAILQMPMFGPGQNFALNYGAIGTVIAHELTHGFDTTGATFNEFGNLHNWWSPVARQQFDKSVQCLREQFSKFFYEKAGMFVNGNFTVTENIADGGGIKFGYEGYQLWRKMNPAREFQLPGLQHYTPEQLFFIGNGQMWCAAESKAAAQGHILGDIHSPEIFRVEGVMRNYPEFGKTFGCTKGLDKLYPDPKDTCTVW